jgi:tetratricopeptide (TPR) repeat protein
MGRIRLAAGLCLLAGGFVLAQAPPEPGVVHPRIPCRADPAFSFALFLPSAFTPERPWPVVFCFHPGGDGEVPVRLLAEAAERRGFIVIGSNDSRNGPWEMVRKAGEVLWKEAALRFPVAEHGNLAMGFSGGARAALYLALSHPGRFAGTLSAGAFDAERRRAPRNAGLSFFLVVGDRDFNRFEMTWWAGEEARRGNRPFLRIFEGGHRWPEAGLLAEGLAFFASEGDRHDGPEVLSWTLDRFRRARRLEEGGRLLEAWREYEALVRLFPEAPGAGEARTARDRLAALPEVSLARERQSRFEKLWERIKEARDPKDLLSVGKTLTALRDGGGADGEAASDLLELEGLSLEQAGLHLLAARRYEEAAQCLTLAASVQPANGRLHYNSACALARTGRREAALASMERAVAAGFRNRTLCEKDPDLESLRKLEAFRRLLDRMGPAP